MGSDEALPNERPARRVRVESFFLDRAPVTNADFRRFVEATGYKTLAEGQEISFAQALKMPTRAEAIGRVIQLALSPASRLVSQILGPASTVVGQIKSIGEKKDEGAEAAPASA